MHWAQLWSKLPDKLPTQDTTYDWVEEGSYKVAQCSCNVTSLMILPTRNCPASSGYWSAGVQMVHFWSMYSSYQGMLCKALYAFALHSTTIRVNIVALYRHVVFLIPNMEILTVVKLPRYAASAVAADWGTAYQDKFWLDCCGLDTWGSLNIAVFTTLRHLSSHRGFIDCL